MDLSRRTAILANGATPDADRGRVTARERQEK